MATIYRGTVRNGVVVFDTTVPLAEGTAVDVAPVNGQNAAQLSTAAAHFHPVGSWEGPPGEIDRLIADVQAERDSDMDLDGDAWK